MSKRKKHKISNKILTDSNKVLTDLKFFRKGEVLNSGSIVVTYQSKEYDGSDLDFVHELHWVVKAFAEYYKPSIITLNKIKESFFKYFPEKKKNADDYSCPPSLKICVAIDDNFEKALMEFDIKVRLFLDEARSLCRNQKKDSDKYPCLTKCPWPTKCPWLNKCEV